MELEELRDKLLQHLGAHEKSSQWRYEELCKQVAALKESKAHGPKEREMSEGIMDKVVINTDGGGRGNDGLGAAAMIAALGNRNQGDDNAALIAALGNRNDSAAQIGPLMAMLGNRPHGDDGFMGGNGIWAILLLALLGRRGFGGGDGDGDGGCARTALSQTILEGVSGIRAAIPQTALETQNALQLNLAQLALAGQQGFAAAKDATQASTFLLTQQNNQTNQNVLEQGCQTRATVLEAQNAIISKIDGNRIQQLETELARLNSAGHMRDSEIRITQNVNQQQSQFQEQRQRQSDLDLLALRLAGSFNQTLNARQGQDVINFGGTMTGSGTQASANNQVR